MIILLEAVILDETRPLRRFPQDFSGRVSISLTGIHKDVEKWVSKI